VKLLIVTWRYIVPAALWAGAIVAFPFVHFLPGDFGFPALLGCLASHTFGGCWMLYEMRGRRDLLGWRILMGLPMTVLFALSLWAMRTDDMQYGSALISGVIALMIWLMFAAMRLPAAE
jgi:hypothetical protein